MFWLGHWQVFARGRSADPLVRSLRRYECERVHGGRGWIRRRRIHACLRCGGEGHYLTFQRKAEDSDDDWGIHVEYDDQSNGDYGCLAACRLGARSLSRRSRPAISLRLAEVTGFDVALRLDPGIGPRCRTGFGRFSAGTWSFFRGPNQAILRRAAACIGFPRIRLNSAAGSAELIREAFSGGVPWAIRSKGSVGSQS